MRTAAMAGPALLLLASPALAHRIDMDWMRLPDGRVRIEVFFGDGRPVAGAEVVVRGPGGAETARGSTDSGGGFEFAAAPGVGLEVEARHEGSHRAALTIPAAPAGGAPAGASPQVPRGGIPWTRLGLGLAAIACLALVLRRVLGRRRAP